MYKIGDKVAWHWAIIGERKLLDQALSLVVKELALVENLSENEVEEKIKTIFEGNKAA